MREEVKKVLDTHQRRRPWRVAFYTCLGLGGAIMIYDPTRSLAEQGVLIRWIWGIFLVAGAIFSIYGTVKDRWLPEWAGLPLQGFTMAGLVWALIAAGGNTARIAFALFLSSIVVMLAGRWWDLFVLGRSTWRIAKRERKQDE